MEIRQYTKDRIPDVLRFERELRAEEDFWGWEIDEKYIAAVCSHFDGSRKAYLDWICVIKSYRHAGVAQTLMQTLRQELKARGADTLVGVIAANEEAQRFYRSLPNALIRDEGIWIDL